MKSPGIIYRQYRQLKKKHLYEYISELRKTAHRNCYYGRTSSVHLTNDSEYSSILPVCLYNVKEGGEAEICSCPKMCNAFVNKWTKETAVQKFNSVINDPGLRRKCYPDIDSLEWALDRDLLIAEKEPNWIGKVIVYLINILEDMLKLTSSNKTNPTDTE